MNTSTLNTKHDHMYDHIFDKISNINEISYKIIKNSIYIILSSKDDFNILLNFILNNDYDKIKLYIINKLKDETILTPLFDILKNNTINITKFYFFDTKIDIYDILQYNYTITDLYLVDPTNKINLILDNNDNITKLYLDITFVNNINNILQEIEKYPNIINLKINLCWDIFDIFDYPIFRNKNLQKLYIRNYLINENILDDLKQNNTLYELHLINSYDIGITPIIENNRTILTKDIQGCLNPLKLIDIFKINDTIQILDLENSINFYDLYKIPEYKCPFNSNIIKFINLLLQVNRSIYSLNLNHTIYENVDETNNTPMNTRFTYYDHFYNNSCFNKIYDINELCKILKNNNQISHLYIKDTDDKNVNYTEEDKQKLLNALQFNTYLIEFEFE